MAAKGSATPSIRTYGKRPRARAELEAMGLKDRDRESVGAVCHPLIDQGKTHTLGAWGE
jgi:hypothetical protein